MQKWTGIGRCASEVEIRYTNDRKAVAKFRFAVNRRYKREGEPDADFFNCIAFGKTAETFEKCGIGKGTKLCIYGEVRNNNYEKDGVKHYGDQIIIDLFEFCESKKDVPAPTPSSVGDGFINIQEGLDEELPFN